MYSRLSNQTEESVECAINALERGAGSLVFSSGMGAISSILLCFLKTGDHVVRSAIQQRDYYWQTPSAPSIADICFITVHVAYACTNKTKIVGIETELFFFLIIQGGCAACLRACLDTRLLPQSY